MSAYLFLSFEPDERLRLDDDLLLLLFELERVLCTDDPELDRLLLDDLTVLRDLLELLLLLVLLIKAFPPSLTADFKTAEPNRLKKLLPPDRLEL